MKVGFLGLGNMGAPIARNLLAAGHTLAVYNRTPGRARELVTQGAREVASPARAATGAEAIVRAGSPDERSRLAAAANQRLDRSRVRNPVQ